MPLHRIQCANQWNIILPKVVLILSASSESWETYVFFESVVKKHLVKPKGARSHMDKNTFPNCKKLHGIQTNIPGSIAGRFDDLSTFGQFWAPKISYWRYDDLCPYFDDFWKLKFYILLGALKATLCFVPPLQLLFMKILIRRKVLCSKDISEYMWWFFWILCLFLNLTSARRAFNIRICR